jgi:hypothetical protein
MKNIHLLGMALTLVLVGCGDGDKAATSNEEAATETTTAVTESAEAATETTTAVTESAEAATEETASMTEQATDMAQEKAEEDIEENKDK